MPATALPHMYMQCQPPERKQALGPQLFATTAVVCGCQEMVVSSNALAMAKLLYLPMWWQYPWPWEDGGDWQTCEHSQGMRTQLVHPMHAVQQKKKQTAIRHLES